MVCAHCSLLLSYLENLTQFHNQSRQMTIPLSQIFVISFSYLCILFGSAYFAEKGLIPKSITQHRFIRVVSLGVYAGAIAFYGSIGLAAQFGPSYLLYFLGSSAAFLVAPLIMNPLGKVALAHKLGSLADVFAFRYPAPWVGGLITLLMLLGVLPLIALQIHAVSGSIHLLNQDIGTNGLEVIFCILMTVFAILFGARHVSTRDKHEGLIFALAIESIFKFLAFAALAFYAIYGVFGSIEAVNIWLNTSYWTEHTQLSLAAGPSRSMLLMFFAFAIAAPHLFHILLTENNDETLIIASRWGFPLYMLGLSLCIPPILWAANKLGIESSPEFHAISLGLASSNQPITILGFIGGFAAASGVLIVITLALASMSINHIMLPLYRPNPKVNFLRFVLNARRALIIGIITAAFLLNQLFDDQQTLISLGIVTFVAVLQFLPGLVGTFYWRDANTKGLVAGLLGGFTVWLLMLFLPLMGDIVSSFRIDASLVFEPSQQVWHKATLISLSINCLAFVIVSLLSKANIEELKAADECIGISPIQLYQGELQLSSVTEMEMHLSLAIEPEPASHLINEALSELSLKNNESRPFALIRIRNNIESNLTTTVGQTLAHIIISRFLPLKKHMPGDIVSESVQSMEHRFEIHQAELTGLAAELNNLRRYHRQLLQDLPTAVCSIDSNYTVLTWNLAMEELTGIHSEEIVDRAISTLVSEWYQLLVDFTNTASLDRMKVEFKIRNSHRLLYLHKSLIESDVNQGEIIIVIEDITDEQKLEQQLLHNQRLASIGQLAAGVAHEIGNPITGIACLAQNIKLDSDQPELLQISDEILEQTNRISSILKSLVHFGHSGRPDMKQPLAPVVLRQCINEAINLLNLSSDHKGINYINRCEIDLKVLGDGQRLLQVFINLLTNARDASKENDEVIIVGKLVEGTIVIDIIDRGHGIAAEDRQKVFEAFYTTKDPGQGTGLGLAIVITIIEEHHGAISTEANESGGTKVSIKLPYLEKTLESDLENELKNDT
ncbi:MAG: PAS domain S-box-containing protein [Candidatus Azotimanducaceae bacterium]|jgi:PAS domain S-box-containing protein